MRSLRKLICMTAMLFASACSDTDARDHLQTAATQAIDAGAGTQLDLNAALPFRWDTLVIVNPYASAEHIDESLGFRWRDSRRETVMHNDHANLLVFLERGSVVDAVLLERRFGDFCCVEQNGRFARNEAVFVVTQDQLGLRLYPKRVGDSVAAAASAAFRVQRR